MITIKENLDIIDSRIIDNMYFIITKCGFFNGYVFKNEADALAAYESRLLTNAIKDWIQ